MSCRQFISVEPKRDSRSRDARLDIKVNREVYDQLSAVKTILEATRGKSFSMSETISLLLDWAGEKITELDGLKNRMNELTTTKSPRTGFL